MKLLVPDVLQKVLPRYLWLVLWAAFVFPASAALNITNPLDRIVAVVNDDVITAVELETEMGTIKKQLSQQNTRFPSDAILKKQLLERMILRRIQLQRAKRMHIRVDDETVNRTVDNIAAQNNLSLSQFREALTREGIDFASFRENMRDEITLNQLQNRLVRNRIMVTKQEIDNFLSNLALRGGENKEFHLGHILITVPEAASAEKITEARAEAESTITKLQQGAEFSQMAIATSDGQQALEGGDLGWRRLEALPTLFSEWVSNHKEGDISHAIRSPSGFHIIKLLEQRSDTPRHVVKQTHVRHILIRTQEFTPSEEARDSLLKIKARLEAGEDFATLAKAHSDDPGSAVEGGDLGWVNPGEMVAPFEKTMNALEVNDLSQLVRTRFGWHVVQVLARRDHDNTEKVQRKNARDTLRARKTDPALQSWFRRLRDEAFVENRL